MPLKEMRKKMLFNIARLLARIQTNNFLHVKHDKKIMYDVNIMIF